MAITQAMATTFKQELLQAEHNFGAAGNSFKMALYISATMDATTSVYTATNEVSGAAPGYTTTGQALTNVEPTTNSTSGITDFDPDEVWSTATFSADGAMIYNDTHASDATVCVLDFGGTKTATAGDFTVVFPAAAIGTAIIEIA
jgi:hypothetical protein